MKHFFSVCKDIAKLIEHKRKILLLFDYDGTLTPIVSRPSEAILSKETRRLLIDLSKNENFNIGIVSGRRLSEVRNLVKIKGIYYAGNHGLEIKGPNTQFLHPSCIRFKSYITKIRKALQEKLGYIKGVIIEDKGLSLSLHYRLVDQKNIIKIKNIFKKISTPYLNKKEIKITKGKKVLELRPPIDWDKGKAVKLIEKLAQRITNSLTIYIGDDRTDEDAFRVLEKKGVSIFVGKSKTKSSAKYYLKNSLDVQNLLRLFLMLEKRVFL